MDSEDWASSEEEREGRARGGEENIDTLLKELEEGDAVEVEGCLPLLVASILYSASLVYRGIQYACSW